MQKFYSRMMEDGSQCITSYHGDEAEVVIPDRNVTILFDELFAGHGEIISVHIPDTVTDLGEFLFDGCESLHHIDLPANLTSLWGYTFCRSGLEEITLPDQLISIPPFAFKDCKNLKRVVCGKGMRKINGWAFSGCDQLEEVVHGPDVAVSPKAFNTGKS